MKNTKYIKANIIADISNSVENMFYKNEDYTLEELRKAIREGIITIEEMTEHFKSICETSMILKEPKR